MEAFFAADLDGDMTVTAAEWRVNRTVRHVAGRPDRFSNWDADRNGIVSVEEVYAFAKSPSGGQGARSNSLIGSYLTLGAARDGNLTAQELDQAGRKAFARYDVNSDGVLSPTELEQLSSDRRSISKLSCKTPW
jgi:Ca2+-binding EF-hand superfamily protein